jgi:hypothetical protein
MSEYELVSLYHEGISVFFTVVTTLMSMIFAYLVAMFFIAHRLGLALFWLLNGLFAVVGFATIGALRGSGVRAALLGEEIRARAVQPGSSIDFLDVAVYIPTDMPQAMTWFFLVAMVLSLVYAIVHRKAQRAAPGNHS